MKKLIAATIAALAITASAAPALAGPRSQERAECWIPQARPLDAGSATPWRYRPDGTVEALVSSDRYQLLEQQPSLCTEILPGLLVYTKDAPDVVAYLQAVALRAQDAVLIGDELVPWALDLWDWSRMAACETHNQWHVVDASGQFHGGLQLAIPGAEALSVAEQIELGRQKLDAEGPGAWPVCARRIGWLS